MGKTKLEPYKAGKEYDRKNLDNAGYKDLYDSIILEIARGRGDKEKHYNYQNDKGEIVPPIIKKGWKAGYQTAGQAWDYDLFRAYVEQIKEGKDGPTQWKNFQALHASWGVSVHSWQRATSNTEPCLTTDAAERLFSAAAQTLQIPIKQYAAKYLKFCEDKGANLRGIGGEEAQVIELQKEYGYWILDKKENYAPGFTIFNDFIRLKVKKTEYQRNTITNDILKFIKGPSQQSGFVTISGPSGSGKSTILANLIQALKLEPDLIPVWHFNRQSQGLNSTADFIDSLWEQADELFPLSQQLKNLYKDSKFQNNSPHGFLIRFLREIAGSHLNTKALVIIVDAIDEAYDGQEGMRLKKGNILSIPEFLPNDVFLIMTSSSFADQVYSGNTLTISLDKNSHRQVQDIQSYIRMKLGDKHVQEWINKQIWDDKSDSKNEQFINFLVAKSDCSFSILSFFFNQIDSFTKSSSPSSIVDYYSTLCLSLFRKNGAPDYLNINIMAVLSLGLSNVSIEAIADFIGCDTNTVQKKLHYLIDNGIVVGEKKNDLLYFRITESSFFNFLCDKDIFFDAHLISAAKINRQALYRLLFGKDGTNEHKSYLITYSELCDININRDLTSLSVVLTDRHIASKIDDTLNANLLTAFATVGLWRHFRKLGEIDTAKILIRKLYCELIQKKPSIFEIDNFLLISYMTESYVGIDYRKFLDSIHLNHLGSNVEAINAYLEHRKKGEDAVSYFW